MSPHPALVELEEIQKDRAVDIARGFDRSVAVEDARVDQQLRLLHAGAPGTKESAKMEKVISEWGTNNRVGRTTQLDNLVKISVGNDKEISGFWQTLLKVADAGMYYYFVYLFSLFKLWVLLHQYANAFILPLVLAGAQAIISVVGPAIVIGKAITTVAPIASQAYQVWQESRAPPPSNSWFSGWGGGSSSNQTSSWWGGSSSTTSSSWFGSSAPQPQASFWGGGASTNTGGLFGGLW